MRLNRFIAQGGLCSRRHADLLIREGKVKVNGLLVTELGVQVDEGQDRVVADGRHIQAPQRLVVLLLNKPRGVLCTASDPGGRRTVLDLVELDVRVVPVGRLDLDSSGALLLTNDGDLMHQLLHPSGHVPKEYIVLTDRELSASEEQRLAGGVRLEGKRTKPLEIERISREGNRPRYRMVLTEGRNRQIRRMMADLGVHVERLHRRSMAGLSVEGMEPGQWRVLLRKEIDQLRRAITRAASPEAEHATTSVRQGPGIARRKGGSEGNRLKPSRLQRPTPESDTKTTHREQGKRGHGA